MSGTTINTIQRDRGITTCSALRERTRQTDDSLLQLSVLLGLVKYSAKKAPDKGRQLTLDIRKRVAHGIPVKGGKGKPVTVVQLKLAKAAAAGAFAWGTNHLQHPTVLESNRRAV